jgi:hypothetical protein
MMTAERITYKCRFCGKTKEATAKDISDAFVAETDECRAAGILIPRMPHATEAFYNYGRDICPDCTGKD